MKRVLDQSPYFSPRLYPRRRLLTPTSYNNDTQSVSPVYIADAVEQVAQVQTMQTDSLVNDIQTVEQVRPNSFRKPKLLIDLLPIDISIRLINYLGKDDAPFFSPHKGSALAMAEVSPRQREAVFEALKYKLNFPIDNWRPWTKLFLHHIRSIHCADISYIVFQNQEATELFSAPTLRHAFISNRSIFLNLVSQSLNLRSLTIEFWVEDNIDLLLSTLEKLNITQLTFDCAKRLPGRDVCVFKMIFKYTRIRKRLAAACNNVTSLALYCTCGCMTGQRSFAPIFQTFPSLKKLTTNKDFPDKGATALSKCESVTLVQPGSVSVLRQIELATKIGSAVTAIEQQSLHKGIPPGIDNWSALSDLFKCPRLEKLHLHIPHGAEQCIPSLYNLASLQLRWFQDLDQFDGQIPVPDGEGGLFHVWEHYFLPKNFVSGILRSSPHLKELCLFRAEIKFEDVELALKKIGLRLEVFGTTFTQQVETPLTRVLLIMKCALKYNKWIKKLELEGVEGLTRAGLPKGRKKENGAAVLKMAQKLRVGAPNLDVEEVLENIVPWFSKKKQMMRLID